MDIPRPPAASTMEGLADQLHEMFMCPMGLIFPNPVWNAVCQIKDPFIESKNVLAILQSNVGATPERLTSEVWGKLKYKDSIKKVHMYPSHPKDEDEPFDFTKFSEQLAEHLPNVEWLHIEHIVGINFKIESTTLKSLKLICPQLRDEVWEVKCPNLVDLEMQNHSPPVKNFGRALMNSPLIESYCSHKYWHNEPLPPLYLPNCTHFTFRRGENTRSLQLYLPKAKEVILEANFSLKTVKMLTEGHKDHAQWNMAPEAELSKFQLSLAVTSAKVLDSLRSTGRVINPSECDADEDEDEDDYEDEDEDEMWTSTDDEDEDHSEGRLSKGV